MRAVLAVVMAASSAVIGVLLVRARRPLGVAPGVTLIWTVAGAVIAETASILWAGVPVSPWLPLSAGFGLGLFAGLFSGRRPPPSHPRHPPRPPR
ncbi:conserved membrane protein of unknown function [Candidatus Hydrogenisulfobacillus filiaventi]|uniref:Uncharacterized protein n=1 Tax=Candidatus Hydrogenisulfobacillus filiaventi TaxID=2707344 RepID=A0A6F8ZJ85_9FIRM|nr:hypothetical protein [Bacillota bacterium]CAB1129650.1 conserved membrane protein of unknown function [Candidatus Hydrogenisulfobacillus filiaventi]